MANTSDTSGSRRDAVRALRSGIGRISDELTAEIQARIPEYARPSDELCTKVVRTAVEQAVEGFVDRVERPGAPWDPEPFRQIGRAEAAEGRTLEPLQSALRLGARVGWRRLTDLGLPRNACTTWARRSSPTWTTSPKPRRKATRRPRRTARTP
ncbi:hypothetical protein [Nonomuraea salmonea]|uniref:hypothetical protein n=1 Tax=Nonomuraea salmonea TaxID=46181 RepID=UPI002FEB14EF